MTDMTFFGVNFGQLVRNKRGIEQLSQDDLAGITGLTKARISQLETGKIRNPQAKTTDALCVALAISQQERAACYVPSLDSLPSRLLKKPARHVGRDMQDVTEEEFGYEAQLSKHAATHGESSRSPGSYDDFFWPLNTPISMDRRMLHRRLGGPRDGSISISEISRNAMVFATHVSWQYGDLCEGWKRDGRFHFMGEPQREGEPLSGRNLQLFGAAKKGYTVRVFTGADSDLVDYQGGFVLDSVHPYYRGNPHEEGVGALQVTYFRLGPFENVNQPTHLYRFFNLGQPDGKDPYPHSDARAESINKAYFEARLRSEIHVAD
jgi:transcriptional regulator with XRE-family HTH domain